MKINYKTKQIKYKNFQVGEYVTCITPEGANPGFLKTESGGGAGWEEGFTFFITEVEPYKPRQCYFGGVSGNGVYEGYLRQAFPEEIQKLNEN